MFLLWDSWVGGEEMGIGYAVISFDPKARKKFWGMEG